MTTTRGNPEQYAELSRLAASIVSQADQIRKLALAAGEIGTAREAESTLTAWRHVAAVSTVRAGEARLAAGELRVTGPNAVDAIYESIDYWRAGVTRPPVSSMSDRLAEMHHAEAVKAGTWAKLDAFGEIVTTKDVGDGFVETVTITKHDDAMVTPGILAELERAR